MVAALFAKQMEGDCLYAGVAHDFDPFSPPILTQAKP